MEARPDLDTPEQFFAASGYLSTPPVEPEPVPAAAQMSYVPQEYSASEFGSPTYSPVPTPEPTYGTELPSYIAQLPPTPMPSAHVADVFVPEPGIVVQPAIGLESPAGGDFSNFTSRSSTEQSLQSDDVSLVDVLTVMLDRGASDLHLTVSAHPTIRLSGALVQLDEFPLLTAPVIQRVMFSILTQAQREKFEADLELDFAYSLPGRARFRVNLYRQRDAVGAAFRVIPYEIKSLESLGIASSIGNFAALPRGFVLVTGPTGSGKSTTLAALVDLANRTRSDHIMTVEDPIEFLHKHKNCIVNQREVGEDTWSFSSALKHVLRQDPDIILVGEMRDLETIQVALTAAETGHLVFATLHTQDAAQTIDRIIDVFPPHQQQQVRQQLAMSLQGVVCQTLCKKAEGSGRVVATEVLVVTPAIRNLIREGKTHQIYSVMQAGAAHGMHTLDQSLAELVKNRMISFEQGLDKCHHVEDYNRLCGRA